jgi:hypothetical protein
MESQEATREQEHRPGEHGQGFTIIVNGRRKTVHDRILSFEKVVRLAYDPPPSGENISITVTYRNGPRVNPTGSLTPGTSVHIQDGMIFNVVVTDKS